MGKKLLWLLLGALFIGVGRVVLGQYRDYKAAEPDRLIDNLEDKFATLESELA